MTTPDSLMVAAAQIDTDEDLDQNLVKIESRVREAADRDCQVLLFHEGCLTGYPDDERVKAVDFDRIETAEASIQQLAGELGIAVLVGTTSQREGLTFNDLLIIDADGRRLGRYAKTWRAGEPWYAAGSGPVIFRVCGVEATTIICHDLRYPELPRLGVAAGARIVFIANNESGLTSEQKLLGYRSMQISRATENLAYAVMANAPADAGDMHRRNSSHGNSMIVDVMGNVLDEAGSFEERLVVARLDLSKSTGEPARRTLGDEHPAYAEWIRTGLHLVRRLDGADEGPRMSTTNVPSPTSILRLGHAQGDITPPVGIYHRMWGAARHDQATGVHRPLLADVMVLESETDASGRFVRVQLDHVLLSNAQTDDVVAEIPGIAGVSRDRVVVTYSHSHSAGFLLPDRIPLPGGGLIEPYLVSLKQSLRELAQAAMDRLDTAVISYARGRCDMAANRDYRDTERNIFATGFNPDETAEDLIIAARVFDMQGTPRLDIVHYACHPTTLAWDNTLLSPDFVGAMRETVTSRTGLPCVYFQAPCGDLGPKEGFVGDTQVADRNGEQLGYAALSALASLGPSRHDFVYAGPVVSGATIGTWSWRVFTDEREASSRRWASETFQLDLPYKEMPDTDALAADLERYTKEQEIADAAGNTNAVRDAAARAERSRRWLRRICELPDGDTCPYRFSVLEMGDAIWITCSAEPYSWLASQLRRRFPHKTVLISPVAGDSQIAYLLPEARYGKGLYQEEPSCLAPGCLEAVLEAMTKGVEQVTGSTRATETT